MRYSWKTELNNPSCSPEATATPKYSFINKWCGNQCNTTSGATFTNRGACEFTNDPNFLVYLSTSPPTNLPTNKLGEQLTLKASIAPPYDPLKPKKDDEGTNILIFVIVIVLGIIVFIVLIILIVCCCCCCRKRTPTAKVSEIAASAGHGRIPMVNSSLGTTNPNIPQPGTKNLVANI